MGGLTTAWRILKECPHGRIQGPHIPDLICARLAECGIKDGNSGFMPALSLQHDGPCATPDEITMRMGAIDLQTYQGGWVTGRSRRFFLWWIMTRSISSTFFNAAFKGLVLAQQDDAATEAELRPWAEMVACTVGNTRAARFYEAAVCGAGRRAIPYEVENRRRAANKIDVFGGMKKTGSARAGQSGRDDASCRSDHLFKT